jgi:histidinol-phosphatase
MRALPGIDFLGEESATSAEAAGPSQEKRWIVDPLDGTKKFVRGLPFFGPCIALEQAGELVLGVMHLPMLREIVWAERGGGAFLNGRGIHVSDQADLDRAYVAYSSEAEFYRRDWADRLERVIRESYHNPGFLDLYSYVCLAVGRVDAVINIGEAPWDIGAARVILEEAGGRLTDFTGAATVYGGTTLATNGKLHGALAEILGATSP